MTPAVRILNVANRYPPWSMGGYEVVSSAAVQALSAAGHNTRVLTTVPDPSDRAPAGRPPPDVHRELRWYWRDGDFPPVGPAGTARLERHNAAVLRSHLSEFEPDVVVWWGLGGLSLSLVEQVHRAGLPSLGLVGDEWMLYGPQVDAWTRRWHGRRGARLAELLVGVPARLDLDAGARWLFNSRQLLASAREAGWSLAGAEVAPPGVDPSLFVPRNPQSWQWRLLYCGRPDPRKGVATAIEALPHLPPEATLVIHGDGDRAFLKRLRKLALGLGVGERVRFQHSDHELVPDVYAQADAVVFPATWREPWGMVPLEAMAIGRPVVASRAGGGPSEYLEDGRNCLQFTAGDAVQLAGALQRLASSPRLRSELVAAGHATAARFTQGEFHARILDELERLTERRGNHRGRV